MECKSNSEYQCPICGSVRLTYGDMENIGHCLFYEWTCDDCGANGREWYKLVFDGHDIEVQDENGKYNYESVNDYILPEND